MDGRCRIYRVITLITVTVYRLAVGFKMKPWQHKVEAGLSNAVHQIIEYMVYVVLYPRREPGFTIISRKRRLKLGSNS